MGWFKKGFASTGGGAVTAAAVLAALVGGAIAAASLSTTGDADIGGILRLNENADPAGVANECRLFALDDDTLQAECGAAGPTTTLVDENGDMSVAGDVTVGDSVRLNAGDPYRIYFDADDGTPNTYVAGIQGTRFDGMRAALGSGIGGQVASHPRMGSRRKQKLHLMALQQR